MRLNKNTKGGFVGPASCVAMLGLLAAGLICPQIDNTYAVDNGTGSGATPVSFSVNRVMIDGVSGEDSTTVQFNVIGFGRASGTIDVLFNIDEYLEITAADNNVDVNMGTIDGASASGTTTISAKAFTVAGNNPSGFDVYVYAPTSTALTGETAGNSATVATTQTAKTLSNLDSNTWGYNILGSSVTPSTSTTLRPVTDAAGAQHILASNTAGSVSLKLACGAKVDSTLPADTYGTDVVLAAVAPFTAGLVEDPAAQ